MKIINTAEAAERMNVSAIRIRQLIRDGRLPAQKVGRDYVIREEDIALVERRPAGRPIENRSVKDKNKD